MEGFEADKNIFQEVTLSFSFLSYFERILLQIRKFTVYS